MSDLQIRREQLRNILEQAEVEVKSALAHVEQMGPFELAEVRGAAAALQAFFDKNGSCVSPDGKAFDPVAFFDKNGSCTPAELRTFDAAAFFDKNGSCAAPSATDPRLKR